MGRFVSESFELPSLIATVYPTVGLIIIQKKIFFQKPSLKSKLI